VEILKWTGKGLQIVSSPLLGSTRLVTSLAVIKNQYMLVGNTRKGLTFLHVQQDKGNLSLTSRDFALTDTCAVDFLFEGKMLGFFQADTQGNVAVFKWAKDGCPVYDPPGLRAMPVGRFHLGHKVRHYDVCHNHSTCSHFDTQHNAVNFPYVCGAMCAHVHAPSPRCNAVAEGIHRSTILS
jgi:hypothetical protein